MTLRIPNSLLDQLRRHGEKTFPVECCGVLVGEFAGGNFDTRECDVNAARTVRRVIECRNACSASPETRYRIAPEELVRIQRKSRETGLAIVGFYHSHPGQSALWSASDLAEAHWTGCSYVISGIEGGSAGATKSFLLVYAEGGGDEGNKRFEEEEIEAY